MRNMYFKMLLIHQLFICIPNIKAKCNAMIKSIEFLPNN